MHLSARIVFTACDYIGIPTVCQCDFGAVSFQVSVNVILADIRYDLEALPALQVTDYTQQESGPMLLKTAVRETVPGVRIPLPPPDFLYNSNPVRAYVGRCPKASSSISDPLPIRAATSNCFSARLKNVA
jgi:hypothetical protein